MPQFDANSFLDTQITGSHSTQKILVEPGEYPAFVADLRTSTGFSDKSQQNWARLDVVFEIEDEAQKARTGKSRILLTYGVMLELDEDSPDGLAHGKGKNVKLGKLREALGKNDSDLNPRELMHCYAKIMVKHDMWEGEPQEKVGAVRKM